MNVQDERTQHHLTLSTFQKKFCLKIESEIVTWAFG